MLEGLQTTGFEAGSSLDLPNLPRGDSSIFGHQTNIPVSGHLGSAHGRQGENFGDFSDPSLSSWPAAWQIFQPFNSSFQIALSPLEYRWPHDLQVIADLGHHSISQQKRM